MRCDVTADIIAHRHRLDVHAGICRIVLHDAVHGGARNIARKHIGVAHSKLLHHHAVADARQNALLLFGIALQLIGAHHLFHAVVRRRIGAHAQLGAQRVGARLVGEGIGCRIGYGQLVVPLLARFGQQRHQPQKAVVLLLLGFVGCAFRKIVIVKHDRIGGAIDRDRHKVAVKNFPARRGDTDHRRGVAVCLLRIIIALDDLDAEKRDGENRKNRNDRQRKAQKTPCGRRFDIAFHAGSPLSALAHTACDAIDQHIHQRR